MDIFLYDIVRGHNTHVGVNDILIPEKVRVVRQFVYLIILFFYGGKLYGISQYLSNVLDILVQR